MDNENAEGDCHLSKCFVIQSKSSKMLAQEFAPLKGRSTVRVEYTNPVSNEKRRKYAAG
jgi:hypothetical protein